MLFVEATLEERPRVDARRGVTLEVDVVAGLTVGLAPEEVIEPQLVEPGRRGVGREVAADALGVVVGVDDHHRGVPTDVGPDPTLDLDVAGEPRLGGRGNRVDVRRRHFDGRSHAERARPVGQFREHEPGASLAAGVHERVE